jgi:hypothetical protein
MEQPSKHAVSEQRVDFLLLRLSALSEDDPPDCLRERLNLLSSRRLRRRSQFLWLKPVFALALFLALGTVLTVHRRRTAPLQTRFVSHVAPAGEGFRHILKTPAAALPLELPLAVKHHPLRKPARDFTAQRMTVRLPYSDAAIDTGTDATIRVSMSQAELAALGFPITLADHRVLAELTLGDDGLPRAVSVSWPLEILKEKK